MLTIFSPVVGSLWARGIAPVPGWELLEEEKWDEAGSVDEESGFE
jgi:hypothetical protein